MPPTRELAPAHRRLSRFDAIHREDALIWSRLLEPHELREVVEIRGWRQPRTKTSRASGLRVGHRHDRAAVGVLAPTAGAPVQEATDLAGFLDALRATR